MYYEQCFKAEVTGQLFYSVFFWNFCRTSSGQWESKNCCTTILLVLYSNNIYNKYNKFHPRSLLSYHCVVVSHQEQIRTALGVGEGAYAEAVGGMKLLHEEVAANLNDLRKLQEASRCQ